VKRTNGESQWAFDDHPVYTSSKDHKKGDVLGGSVSLIGGEMGAVRYPIGPTADIPSDLGLAVFRTGRMLVTHTGFFGVLLRQGRAGKIQLHRSLSRDLGSRACAGNAKAQGDWNVIERSRVSCNGRMRGSHCIQCE